MFQHFGINSVFLIFLLYALGYIGEMLLAIAQGAIGISCRSNDDTMVSLFILLPKLLVLT